MNLHDVGRLALAAGLDPEGARVAMAIAQTEGGLKGAVGDNGQSYGPFQFYTGGQLQNFARTLGVSLTQAGQIARNNPETAIQWALKPGGYLGDAIRKGQQQGLRGADLATYAQRYGQVSVSPQRAGQNFGLLFPGGGSTKLSAADAPKLDQSDYQFVQRTSLPQTGFVAKPGQTIDQATMVRTGGATQPAPKLDQSDWSTLRGGNTPPQPTYKGGQAPKLEANDWSLINSKKPAGAGWGDIAARGSQFGNRELTPAEAKAWCGPQAAMAFAASYGRNPTVNEAKQMATSLGWSTAGMSGPANTSKMISNWGVPNQFEAWSGGNENWGKVRATLAQRKPVILSTPGHYFYASDYDPSNDTYNVGTSGTDLVGGSEWLTPKQMSGFAVSGPFQGAIYGM